MQIGKTKVGFNSIFHFECQFLHRISSQMQRFISIARKHIEIDYSHSNKVKSWFSKIYKEQKPLFYWRRL